MIGLWLLGLLVIYILVVAGLRESKKITDNPERKGNDDV
jgi:hypothetical protein